MIHPVNRAISRGPAIFAALAALLVMTMILAACGGKRELGTAPASEPRTAASTAPEPATGPGTQPAQGGRLKEQAQTDDAAAAADSLATVDAGSGRTPSGDAGRAKGGKEASDGDAAKTRATPAWQMLRSAGRDPDAVQPEPGFMLSVPDVIRDGEPFAVSFAADGAERVTFAWRGKNLFVPAQADAPGRFTALLPVPLDEKSASLPLALTVAWAGGAEETFKAAVPVKKRRYPVQRLKVDSKFVTPPAEVQDKIKRDRAEMRAVVTQVTPRRYWTLPMQRPVPGEVTSLYGMRRVFNGKPKNPHKGVDYDADEGDPVALMEDGVVVLVSDHYYGGNTVVVDHGLGVMSAYLHLSGFNVAPGQSVTRGETIGFIGSTGRVTGSHLHLSLYVLGESVNAATCLDR